MDEELPVLTDADRFVVQNIYVTSDNYIYVAGFEMDLVNRQASRAILIALDENGSLYATPYDRTIVPEGVARPARRRHVCRHGARTTSASTLPTSTKGQAEVLAHEKSDGSVTTLSYVDAGRGDHGHVRHGRGAARHRGRAGVRCASPSADGARMEALDVGQVFTFRMYHGSGNTFYYLDAQTGGVGQVNLAQGSDAAIVSGEMDLGGGRAFSDFAEVAVGARGRLPACSTTRAMRSSPAASRA